MASRSARVSGIILSRQNYGEADKIVVAYTKEFGKMRLKATGIRRLNSKRAPHLELFNEVDMLLHLGRSYPLITEARLISNYTNLKANLDLCALAFYLAEVMDKLLPDNQPLPVVYDYLVNALVRLNAPGIQKAEALRSIKEFILYLTRELGYLPRDQYPTASLNDFVETVTEKRIRSKRFIDEI